MVTASAIPPPRPIRPKATPKYAALLSPREATSASIGDGVELWVAEFVSDVDGVDENEDSVIAEGSVNVDSVVVEDGESEVVGDELNGVRSEGGTRLTAVGDGVHQTIVVVGVSLVVAGAQDEGATVDAP